MRPLSEKAGVSCTGGCPACHADGGETPSVGLSGWRLVVSAVAVFLFPLALALAGAMLVAGGEGAKFLGAVGGLTVGLIVGVVVSRLVSRTGEGAA